MYALVQKLALTTLYVLLFFDGNSLWNKFYMHQWSNLMLGSSNIWNICFCKIENLRILIFLPQIRSQSMRLSMKNGFNFNWTGKTLCKSFETKEQTRWLLCMWWRQRNFHWRCIETLISSGKKLLFWVFITVTNFSIDTLIWRRIYKAFFHGISSTFKCESKFYGISSELCTNLMQKFKCNDDDDVGKVPNGNLS